jgi:hypothetical protein
MQDFQITFKTSARQLDFAQRIVEEILKDHPQAVGGVNNDHGFVTVSMQDGYKCWLFQIGVRCAIKNMYTKKPVRFYLVSHSYDI